MSLISYVVNWSYYKGDFFVYSDLQTLLQGIATFIASILCIHGAVKVMFFDIC